MQLKSLGIFLLLIVIILGTALLNPLFLTSINIQSLISWTSLFAFCAIGVAFVIITGGIDLSIGSVIALSGCLLIIFLDAHYIETDIKATVESVDIVRKSGARDTMDVTLAGNANTASVDDEYRFTDRRGAIAQGTVASIRSVAGSVHITFREPNLALDVGTELSLREFRHRPVALVIVMVLLVSMSIGLIHGLLITKVRLQPFVVTLCGLLIYRSLARVLSNDLPLGFANTLDTVKTAFTGNVSLGGQPFKFPIPFTSYISDGSWGRYAWNSSKQEYLLDADGQRQLLNLFQWVELPVAGLFLIVTGLIAWFLINRTVFGRYLLALGNNEQAAKFSGINTDRMIIAAYMICATLAGFTGILFAFSLNSVEPSSTAEVYELYAIAAAVIGGCSLRGGSGSIVGVIIGTAVMRSLFLAIGALGISRSWENMVIGVALLLAVIADELFRFIGNRRQLRQQSKIAAEVPIDRHDIHASTKLEQL